MLFVFIRSKLGVCLIVKTPRLKNSPLKTGILWFHRDQIIPTIYSYHHCATARVCYVGPAVEVIETHMLFFLKVSALFNSTSTSRVTLSWVNRLGLRQGCQGCQDQCQGCGQCQFLHHCVLVLFCC